MLFLEKLEKKTNKGQTLTKRQHRPCQIGFED